MKTWRLHFKILSFFPKPRRAYPFALPPTPKRNFWPTTRLTSKLIFSFFSFRSQEEISFQHLFFTLPLSLSFLLSFFSFRFKLILNLLLSLLLFPLRFVHKKEFHSNLFLTPIPNLIFLFSSSSFPFFFLSFSILYTYTKFFTFYLEEKILLLLYFYLYSPPLFFTLFLLLLFFRFFLRFSLHSKLQFYYYSSSTQSELTFKTYILRRYPIHYPIYKLRSRLSSRLTRIRSRFIYKKRSKLTYKPTSSTYYFCIEIKLYINFLFDLDVAKPKSLL